NLTGSPTHQTNASKVLNGTIPEFPSTLISSSPNTKFFMQLLLANNNLIGPIPKSLGDTIPVLSLTNNSFLTGPLPSRFSSSTQEPWTQSWRCAFTNTSLCIPYAWTTQPSCLRDSIQSLPTCGSSVEPEKKPIASVDPYLSSKSVEHNNYVGVFQLIGFMFGGSFLVFLGMGVYMHFVRRSFGGMDGGDVELSTTMVDEEYTLPAYSPPENGTELGTVSVSPVSDAPPYYSVEQSQRVNEATRRVG
ncbi:UNVERIFIED_CONTAM: hypothetical protein HDU68_011026, partial [Siphonaria sp. JEL0065]